MTEKEKKELLKEVKKLEEPTKEVVLNYLYNEFIEALGVFLVLKKLPLIEVENLINNLPEIIRPPKPYVAMIAKKTDDGKIQEANFDRSKPMSDELIQFLLYEQCMKILRAEFTNMDQEMKNDSMTLFKQYDLFRS